MTLAFMTMVKTCNFVKIHHYYLLHTYNNETMLYNNKNNKQVQESNRIIDLLSSFLLLFDIWT